MAQILVVDDDGHIREVVRFALEQAGHTVREAGDGASAIAAFEQHRPDLLVLDIVMPEDDGLDVCRRIRAKSRTPIVFLSSRDDELDRVLGLELGADDYVTKPFSPRELVARVKAVLRRVESPSQDSPSHVLARGKLVLDVARHRATWDGHELVLTVMEFAFIQVLLEAPGRVFSRQQLVDRAYEPGHAISERTVDSHVRRLRQKLAAIGADVIETVYGMGYRLREDI